MSLRVPARAAAGAIVAVAALVLLGWWLRAERGTDADALRGRRGRLGTAATLQSGSAPAALDGWQRAPAARPRPPAAVARRAAVRTAARSELPEWLRESIDPESGAGEVVTNRRRPLSGEGLDGRHLAVLEEIIALNGLGEGSARWDQDDGDGVLEPWELGFQAWQGGRLVALALGPDPYWTFGYAITQLPARIGDLDALRYLDLHGNALEALPDALRDLAQLRELRLHENRLATLPERMGALRRLRILSLGANEFTALPPVLRGLDSLEELHLSENPLEALPDEILDLPRLRVLGVEQSHPDARRGLAELPEGLARHAALEDLYVSGNRVGCAGPAPRLGGAGGLRVHGLATQACSP